MSKALPARTERGRAVATILVVEFDPYDRHLLRVLLELAGHTVVEAHHVVPTWPWPRWFAATHGRVKSVAPDLVVIDTILKLGDAHTWDARETSASELLERLRADPKTARIPILAMSTHPSYSATPERDSGADDFLSKPFDPEDFRETVDALLDRGLRGPA